MIGDWKQPGKPKDNTYTSDAKKQYSSYSMTGLGRYLFEYKQTEPHLVIGNKQN